MSSRAVLVTPEGRTDAERERWRRVQIDYCERRGLVITALVDDLADACRMVAGGVADAVVVATPRDLAAIGVHVAASMVGRPMPVRRPAPVDVDARDRRPRIVRGPFGG